MCCLIKSNNSQGFSERGLQDAMEVLRSFFCFFMGDTVWIKPGSLSEKKKKKKQKKKNRSNLLETVRNISYRNWKLNVTSVAHKRFKQSVS